MNLSLGLRAGAVQALTVGLTFVVLLLAPLPEDFFRENGAFAGPLAWFGCALVTALVLRIPRATAALAAVGGGVAGALVGVASHGLGMVVGVAAFGALVAALDGRRPLGRRARATAGR